MYFCGWCRWGLLFQEDGNITEVQLWRDSCKWIQFSLHVFGLWWILNHSQVSGYSTRDEDCVMELLYVEHFLSYSWKSLSSERRTDDVSVLRCLMAFLSHTQSLLWGRSSLNAGRLLQNITRRRRRFLVYSLVFKVIQQMLHGCLLQPRAAGLGLQKDEGNRKTPKMSWREEDEGKRRCLLWRVDAVGIKKGWGFWKA